MFNYNIVYTITMKIVTAGAKWLKEFLSPQIGYFFETKHSGPFPTNGGNRIIK